MSAVLDRIAYYWFGRGDSSFLTPRSIFQKEDLPLIEAGVFHPSGQELTEVPCPFGCSEREPIHLIEGDEGKVERFVVCSHGEGEKTLEPEEYELLAFNSSAYAKHMAQTDKVPKTTRKGTPQKKKARPRKTNWIKIEQTAVLEFADDPKRNTEHKQPHELCHHVWQLNRDEFEAAARLSTKERGYKNADALRAHFYRQKR